MTKDKSELGVGLYWMAEKSAWGYEGSAPNPADAYRLYKQAADLGVSDAWIRIGELLEHGKGVERNIKKAFEAYRTAAQSGNFFALAYAAMLLSRTPSLNKADELWDRFFEALNAKPEPGFNAASRGELLHNYINIQIGLGREPRYLRALQEYRLEIAGHHQRVLEHASTEQLTKLDGVFRWIELNLGPWPIAG
jgi:TPR repeat protein